MAIYDVIVVGARCAGAPTATLLASAGLRVLLVDRDDFPSDTVSTHFVHPPGIAALRRWGLLERLVQTGCPPVTTYRYDFGPFVIAGSPLPTADGVKEAYGPRRTVLDALLVDAATQAGVDVRTRFGVTDLVWDDGRVVGIRGRAAGGDRPITEHARLVVGADGRHSVVAASAGAPTSRTHTPFSVGYYAYWSSLAVGQLDLHLRPHRAVMAFDTNDGRTCLVVAAPHNELAAFSRDVENRYLQAVRMVHEYAAVIDDAHRESRIVGMAMPSFWRQAWGPGWALVGDARCDRDPCTAQGITSAFLDAEALADGWLDVVHGNRTEQDALAAYAQTRENATLPMYEVTCDMATLEPPPPDRATMFATVAQDPAASQRFVSMIAGTLSVPEFFTRQLSGAT